MKKVLILGGSVFIGKALAKHFIENGDDVYVLNRGNHPCIEGAKQLIADRNDQVQFNEAIADEKFDIVIDGSAYIPEQTQISVDKFRGNVDHYVHLSTATVYEEGQLQPYKEDESKIGSAKSWGQYSTDKIACEKILFSEYKENGFPMSIVRPFYVYGNENNLDRESYVFSRIVKGLPIIVPGRGECKLQFGHIDDLCEAIYKIANTDKSIGEAYNVSGEITTFADWIRTCGKVLEIEPKMILVNSSEIGHKSREWFPFRDIDMIGDISKIESGLGIKPKYNLYRGLEEVASHHTNDEWAEMANISGVELRIINELE